MAPSARCSYAGRVSSSESGPVDPRWVDALLALAVASVISVAITVDLDGTGRATAGAYLSALGFGAVLLARRRAPRLVLTVTVLGIYAYYALDFAGIGIALPAVAALYSTAEAGCTRFAVGAGAMLLTVSSVAQIVAGTPLDYLVSYEMFTNGALVVTAIALGASVRARREARAHQERLRRMMAAEHALAAARRVQMERMLMARDLHDAVGHTMSVIAVHTHVAAEAIGHDDAVVRCAVDRIRQATADAMRELRTTVKVLRSPTAGIERGSVGVRGLGGLADGARVAGLAVDLDVEVPPDVLDGAIDAATYRIVQESLTNVLRHADATRVTVRAQLQDEQLHLTVADDGHGSQGRGVDRSGAGLAGMRERVALLGGELTTDDHATGFTVRARPPVRLR